MKMNTNMNELSISELEQVNGGICGIAVAACVVGVISAAIKVADFVYDTVKGK
jgi:lactobin A/cerein 7B family class IIb bacteriocin